MTGLGEVLLMPVSEIGFDPEQDARNTIIIIDLEAADMI